MKIISLGSACQVKVNIDRFFENTKTNFFDWLITDFQSVLHVFKHINDEFLLSDSNFTFEHIFYNKERWTDTHHKIEHTQFKMISVHDVPLNVYCLNEFILRYERRRQRLKEMICSNENIHMIHCIDHQFMDGYIITLDDINKFKEYLFDINPYSINQCFLHIVIPPKYNCADIQFDHLIQNNVYVYYLNETNQDTNDWKNTNFNWEIVFNNVKNIG